MQFKVVSMTSIQFESWANKTALDADAAGKHLDWNKYEQLSKPTRNTSASYFHLHSKKIYQQILDKYMGHHEEMNEDNSTDTHDHSMMKHMDSEGDH